MHWDIAPSDIFCDVPHISKKSSKRSMFWHFFCLFVLHHDEREVFQSSLITGIKTFSGLKCWNLCQIAKIGKTLELESRGNNLLKYQNHHYNRQHSCHYKFTGPEKTRKNRRIGGKVKESSYDRFVVCPALFLAKRRLRGLSFVNIEEQSLGFVSCNNFNADIFPVKSYKYET